MRQDRTNSRRSPSYMEWTKQAETLRDAGTANSGKRQKAGRHPRADQDDWGDDCRAAGKSTGRRTGISIRPFGSLERTATWQHVAVRALGLISANLQGVPLLYNSDFLLS